MTIATRTATSLATLALVLVAGPALAQQADTDGGHAWGERNAPELAPAFDAQFRAPIQSSDVAVSTEVFAEGLEHPWAIQELPDGAGFLVAERPGRLRHISPDGVVSEPITGVPEVENRAPGEDQSVQAGLLDVKIGPDFAQDRMIYMTYAKPLEDDMSATAAARGRLSEDLTELTEVEDIFVQSPPSDARMHYGSRIVFDGRGHAFITTGEHFTDEYRDYAQQLDNTYGVVARVNLDGSVPETNPFVGRENADPQIWSYGHRNIQGAAMRDGMLWIIEHGPAGGDELNLVLPGRNYGWPFVSYGRRYDGPPIGSGQARMPSMEEPIYFWDPSIAPGDMAFYEGETFSEWEGDILIAALVAPGIVRLTTNGPMIVAEERLLTDLGRVRDVEVLSDGGILIATDYEDGQILRLTRDD